MQFIVWACVLCVISTDSFLEILCPFWLLFRSFHSRLRVRFRQKFSKKKKILFTHLTIYIFCCCCSFPFLFLLFCFFFASAATDVCFRGILKRKQKTIKKIVQERNQTGHKMKNIKYIRIPFFSSSFYLITKGGIDSSISIFILGAELDDWKCFSIFQNTETNHS